MRARMAGRRALMADSVLRFILGGVWEWMKRCSANNGSMAEMVGSVGREKTAVGQKESVKSRGKYWDGRDKIDWYMVAKGLQ
ncbi:hypothetical protein T4B_1108 [Trichinella pseudospiralis]|uniref:Uncharacterized protein n=1 Tax=Trichinella pseudospiralis TaxID=6337 RepID=A0A0V1GHQ3_TRIPS|nr:hypothetical protein T4B_1108 [Trichinella pseudospiralis]